jgi:hypothetical protein
MLSQRMMMTAENALSYAELTSSTILAHYNKGNS